MRKVFCWTLALLSVLMCFVVPKSFAQSGGSPHVVRLIYFVPRGNTPQPDIDTQFDTVLKDVQKFYADEMERHGFGRKTFRFETDRRGKAVVNRVNGRFKDAHYLADPWLAVWKELETRFNRSQNIYLVVVELTGKTGLCGNGNDRDAVGGDMMIRAGHCFNIPVTAHEFGHAFGLEHDFHNDAYVMSYGAYRDALSPCHAEWLNVHRYLNKSQPNFNRNTEIAMAPPAVSPPHAVRLRFSVADPDGLHQAQLYTPATDPFEAPGFPRIVGCKSLKGRSDTVEFVTTELIQGPAEKVMLQVMDVHGNFTWQDFPIDMTRLLPRGTHVSIPDANLAAVIRETLALAPNARLTQLDMLKLTTLEAPERQIADLTGLEQAVQLKSLHLSGNRIREIAPLVALKQLKSLFLDGNQVENIARLVELPHLTTLFLSNNPIRDITPIGALTQLRGLSLGGDSIRDISALAPLTQLQDLHLYGHPIDDMTPLRNLTALEYLNLGSVQISDIRLLASFVKLKGLFLTQNQIRDITPLAALTGLEVLILVENQISDIRPLTGLTRLQILHLANNPILNTAPLQVLRQNNPTLELDIEIPQGPVVRQVPHPKPPAMYWIDTAQGSLSQAMGAHVENLLPSVRNATSLAIDVAGGKLYWTEKTSERTGSIRSVNLAGKPNVQLVKALTSVPLDIALDAAAGKIYLANSWGKIQSLNVDGTGFKDLIKGLEAPSEIALDVAGGKVYWTEKANSVRRANLDGSTVETLATGLANPTGIAIADGRLYWTTQPNERAGNIQRANLDGSNVETLATVPGAPEGIGVDPLTRKVYWANTLGGIQRADLDGQNVQTLITDLRQPANLVLGEGLASIPEPIVTPLPKITGPWLWMIAPTAHGQGGAKSTDVDSLRIASNGAVTEAQVAAQGARAGDVVGNYAWTPGPIAPTGENNINAVVNRIGLVKGQNPSNPLDDRDINDHSAYALITLVAPAARSGVRMRVGSDDSIKVWLNGKVVHKNAVDRGATDFLEGFTVELNQGNNRLLVKVSELWGGWSLFVGIDADVKVTLPTGASAAAPLFSAAAVVIPTETVLLANYPNPFNPETWIPYQLSEAADVTVRIYAADGRVVRTLTFGHQDAGLYHTRSRAAYWDGKNGLGEPVASGVYFYTLTAGDFTATRKLLILK